MLYLKARAVVATLAVVTIVGLAWTGTAWAGTDLTNVAFEKTVTVAGIGNAYGRAFAESVTQNGSVTVSGEAARRLIVADLVPRWYLNWAYPNVTTGNQDSGFWIDLGREYNISRIEIVPRRTDKWASLRQCPVYGSAEQTLEAPYSFTIPNVGASSPTYTKSVSDWTGVRWIRIQSSGIGDQLTLGQIRVIASVPTWGNFIGGVTATASRTYNRGEGDYYTEDTVRYRVSNLVDHSGMTDQGGPSFEDPHAVVGSPYAMSMGVVDGTGLWMTNSYMNQAVTFDLGGTYSLDQMVIWNLNQATWSTSTMKYTDRTNRGVSDALIEYSRDGGVNWTALADNNGGDLSNGNFTIPRATTGILGDPMYNFSQLAVNCGSILANKVRLTVKGNHGDGAYAGLASVRFYGESVYVPPVIPGDTNGDLIVDATDSKVLAFNWGTQVTPGDVAKGDFNGDGWVDARDAAIMAAHWGDHTGGEATAPTAVPEPSSLALLVVGLAALLAIRRKNHR